MNWMTIGKSLVTFVASAGVGTVVTNMVKATTPANISTANKVLTVVGGFVLSSMAGTIAAQYVGRELDEIFPNKPSVTTETKPV